MSDPQDRTGEQWADIDLVMAAIHEEVRRVVWASTGGSSGCALCDGLTFRERIRSGPRHYDCAAQMERTLGAEGVEDYLKRGGLTATLSRVLTDPRLGQWKQAAS